jgi:hypothetical protein
MDEERDEKTSAHRALPEQAWALLPPCCHSGCTACVLDYPELFINQEQLEMLALLEAIEQAQEAILNPQDESPTQ